MVSLQYYSNHFFVKFVKEQLISPNSRQIIDEWIEISAELFDEVIIYNNIPIIEIPPVQKTYLISSIDEKCVKLVKRLKGKLLSPALKDLNNAKLRCNIPTFDDFMSFTKYNPLDWNSINNLQQSPN